MPNFYDAKALFMLVCGMKIEIETNMCHYDDSQHKNSSSFSFITSTFVPHLSLKTPQPSA